nr:hypothetical protein [Mesorhizobium sp.]
MNLLLARDQKSAALFSLIPLRIGSGVVFHLHAELELDQEEEVLIKKYRFAGAPLVLSDPIEDIKQAFRPALLLGFLAFIVIWAIISFGVAVPLSILVTLVMTAVYFKTLREQILVKDLLDGGRVFRCDSIVGLIEKEAFIEGICEYLRQVLESAKHWQDREAILIRPLDKREAKLAVLKARRG